MYQLSRKSKRKLQGVHPDLIKVIERAIEITTIDFGVLEGVRAESRQRALFESGDSLTLKSNHLLQADGYSHAVDLFVLVGGHVTWEHSYFRKVIQAVFTASIEHGVQIEAGALWRSFVDSPHIQLNRKYYK